MAEETIRIMSDGLSRCDYFESVHLYIVLTLLPCCVPYTSKVLSILMTPVPDVTTFSFYISPIFHDPCLHILNSLCPCLNLNPVFQIDCIRCDPVYMIDIDNMTSSDKHKRRIFQIFKSLMQCQTFFVCAIYHYKFNILLPFDLADTDNVFMI